MGVPRFVIEDSDADDAPSYSTVARTVPKGTLPGDPAKKIRRAAIREREIHEAAVAIAAEMVQRQSIGGRIVTPASPEISPTPAMSLPQAPVVTAPALEDLPTLLVDETRKRVKSGEAKVNVRDGIAAQSILERRAERAEDKQFMLNLARALAGGGASGPVPVLSAGPVAPTDEDVIEGDYEDLGDDSSLAPAHLRQTVE